MLMHVHRIIDIYRVFLLWLWFLVTGLCLHGAESLCLLKQFSCGQLIFITNFWESSSID